MRSRLRSATLPSKQVVVERWQVSMSLIGRRRVRMQSRKFSQCATLLLLNRGTSTSARSLPFSGTSL